MTDDTLSEPTELFDNETIFIRLREAALRFIEPDAELTYGASTLLPGGTASGLMIVSHRSTGAIGLQGALTYTFELLVPLGMPVDVIDILERANTFRFITGERFWSVSNASYASQQANMTRDNGRITFEMRSAHCDYLDETMAREFTIDAKRQR